VAGSTRPASASGISSAKAAAAALYANIQTINHQIAGLGQRYDLEVTRAQMAANRERHDLRLISRDRLAVGQDRSSLQRAAVHAYVTNGSVASTNPLFVSNPNDLGATSIYNEIAEGNLSGSVATLTNAQATLHAARHQLGDARRAAVQAASAIRNEIQHAAALESKENAELAAADAQVHNLVLAAENTTVAPPRASGLGNQNFPPPPSNPQAAIAVRAAESYLGVPYCWGGASRACVDCSGLTMLAWEAAGVDLPHYSGAQMSDSTPVPVSALEPGDLLFYGPGGSDHVAMYIGNGEMIQAPHTGAYVEIVPADFSSWFAGAGRP
jgi:cell wall-associated NlpC family hydrolase